ncbi:MAG TPA: transglutaminase domain-containing protein [Polyangiales bacterium]|nr:transglutaminase domain-containing protein [Polyangiales bacterium]
MALALCAATVSGARADEPILHEYVPDVRPNEVALTLGEAEGAPRAIEYQGEQLPSPEGAPAQDAPAFTATPGDGRGNEAPGQRSPHFRPDRLTELEGHLDYYEAFNPAIAPFKRVTSLDAVQLDADGKTPVLSVSDARRHQLQVETPDATVPDARPRDRFWGDVTLDFSSGRSVPLPSVAPDSRILSLSTTPELKALRIERDSADNFYAHAVGELPAGPVRVVFLTDAPRSYFGMDVPAVPLASLAREAPSLEPSIAKRARTFARELGLGPESDLKTAVETLTRYFREFEESATPPEDSGDLYLDLVHGKKGVCRHRAYGFVVTAQALGILARFIQNEAHSWVEVKIPGQGFLRIDLGGAAHGLTAHGADDRPSYVPAQPDSLPRPAAYQHSYSTLEHGVTGLRGNAPPEAVAGRWVNAADGEQDKGPPVFMAGSKPGAAQGGDGANGAPDTRKPLALALQDRRDSVLRGQKLSLGGRITDAAGKGVPALRVEISLAATERKQRMLLGVTVTDAAGYFRAAVGVPQDLAVGDYRLVVLTPGSAEYLPVVAE